MDVLRRAVVRYEPSTLCKLMNTFLYVSESLSLV